MHTHTHTYTSLTKTHTNTDNTHIIWTPSHTHRMLTYKKKHLYIYKTYCKIEKGEERSKKIMNKTPKNPHRQLTPMGQPQTLNLESTRID